MQKIILTQIGRYFLQTFFIPLQSIKRLTKTQRHTLLLDPCSVSIPFESTSVDDYWTNISRVTKFIPENTFLVFIAKYLFRPRRKTSKYALEIVCRRHAADICKWCSCEIVIMVELIESVTRFLVKHETSDVWICRKLHNKFIKNSS